MLVFDKLNNELIVLIHDLNFRHELIDLLIVRYSDYQMIEDFFQHVNVELVRQGDDRKD